MDDYSTRFVGSVPFSEHYTISNRHLSIAYAMYLNAPWAALSPHVGTLELVQPGSGNVLQLDEHGHLLTTTATSRQYRPRHDDCKFAIADMLRTTSGGRAGEPSGPRPPRWWACLRPRRRWARPGRTLAWRRDDSYRCAARVVVQSQGQLVVADLAAIAQHVGSDEQVARFVKDHLRPWRTPAIGGGDVVDTGHHLLVVGPAEHDRELTDPKHLPQHVLGLMRSDRRLTVYRTV